MNLRQHWIGITIITLFFLIGLFTINDYGVTWDSFLHFNSGDSYIEYFKTGELKIEEVNDLRYYGPFSDIMASLSYSLFTEKLNFLDEIASHHLIPLLWSVITLIAVYLFCNKAFNKKTAIVSTLLLAIFPRFIAHAHNNMKDIPLTALFTLSIISFWKGFIDKSWKWIILSGIFLGLGFAVKINILFVPIILVIWGVITYKEKILNKIKGRYELIAYPFVALLTAIIVWPWLWTNTFSKLIEILNHFGKHEGIVNLLYMGKMYVNSSPWHYAPVWLSISTPLFIILLGLVGIYFSRKNKSALLISTWFLVILISTMFFSIYDGIRQFLSIVPAFCILAGFGFIKLIKKYKHQERYFWIALIILISVLLFHLASIHPYEEVYFNNIVGKAGGAEGKFEVEYWGQAYKEGVNWLNENVKKDAVILLPHGLAEHIAQYYMRPDLKTVQKGKADYLIFITRNNIDPIRGKKTIYKVTVDDADLLKIYYLKD